VFARSLLKKLALATLVLLGLILVVITEDLQTMIHRILDLLRNAGPGVFFVAMILLPALGAPLSFFTLTAGSVFGPQMGLPLVMLLSLVAITANMAISHLLARRALRPLLSRFLQHLGYRMPQVGSADGGDLTVLLRVTPGIPFAVQNYLLGLAAVPFARYLLVSCLVALPLNAAIIFFGEALLQGRGRGILIGLLALLSVMAVISLVRRRHAGIKVAARDEVPEDRPPVKPDSRPSGP
jgi:uncharacterized membrane protein YdjX (TVP38/TMEM64 family)